MPGRAGRKARKVGVVLQAYETMHAGRHGKASGRAGNRQARQVDRKVTEARQEGWRCIASR